MVHERVFKQGQLGYGSCMQTIYPTSLTPEQYAEQEHHKQVPPPENCPNCERARALEALSYYHRYILPPLSSQRELPAGVRPTIPLHG